MSILDAPTALPGARLLFTLDPGVAHLNHGAFGAVPAPVQRAQQRLRDEMDADPVRFYGHGVADRVAHARRHIATFLGADPEGSALVANVTAGTAVVLGSLDLRPGDAVVTTDHGHGGVRMGLAAACRRAGVELVTVHVPLTAPDDDIVDRIRAALTGRTRLVAVDQITSPTARIFPVAAVIAVARERDAAVLVDAAHAPGLVPTPVEDVGADFWVGNLHKWAYAPRGTALLAVAPRWRPRIRPLVDSWAAEAGFPAALEYQGTIDYSPWLAAPTGLFVLRGLGVAAVREHNAALAAYGQRVLGEALALAPEDLPGSGGAPLPMRLVPLPPGVASDPVAATALRRRLADELGTQAAIHGWRDRGLLRISAQVYNRAEEYDRLAERLPGFLRRL